MQKTLTALAGPFPALAVGTIFAVALAAQQANQQTATTQNKTGSKELIESGKTLFEQQCGFCHGRDGGGGETGPSLLESELVKRDKTGSELAAVIRNGRPDKGMPKFDLSDQAMSGMIAFIHNAEASNATNGKRRGVVPADLQTGNASLGKGYFENQGKCSSCHSPTGDLAHVAKRLVGLRLEMRMLYPTNAKSKATITLPSGKTLSGEVAFNDEFTVSIKDEEGRYRSFPKTADLNLKINAPAEAHAELLSKYTDDDIHNLMAYLQTLK